MRSILQELKLDDFVPRHKRIRRFLQDAVSKKQSLKPMFEAIRKGILKKHPAILEFAELALQKKWLRSSKHVLRAVHVTYILEALTATMCSSHDFFVELYDHYKAKERMCGINTMHMVRAFLHGLGITGSVFETAKAVSIDPTMIYFRTQRGFTKSHLTKNQAKELLKDKKINYLEYRLLVPLRKRGLERVNELVRINIYEAGITEYKKGFEDNALCAHVLSEDIKNNPPRTVFKKKSVIPEDVSGAFYASIAEKENLFPTMELSQAWTSLYTTWNMTFVLNALDEWDLILPKLFIPSIIDAHSEDFIGIRFVSLWLTLNYVLFRKYERKKKVAPPAYKVEMAKAWAAINKKYALQLAKKEAREDSKKLGDSFSRFFSHPIYNIFALIKEL